MIDIIILTDKDDGTATLTTLSPQSHYGIPVLRIEGAKDTPDNDYGPHDIIAIVGDKVIYAAVVVAGWALDAKRTPEERDIARLFLCQWPDGPQIPSLSSISALAKKAGSTTSKAKSDASRENGKKGGRPKIKK